MSTPMPEPPLVAPAPPPVVGRWSLVLSSVVIELGLVFGAILWCGLWEDSSWKAFAKLRWSWGDFALGAALSMPLFVLFWFMERWAWGPFRHIRHISDDILRPMLQEHRWPDVLLFSTLAGFCEELLFRGAIQVTLIDLLGLGPGIFLAALIFGLAHAITFTYVIAATLIGLFLGWIFWWTDSLLVVMVTHGLYDVWAMLFLIYGPRPQPAPTPQAPTAGDTPFSEQDSCTS